MKTKIAYGILGYLLIAAYAAILLFAGYCRLVEGHWPSYNNPDPKNLPVPVIGYSVALVLLMAVTSIIAYPLLLGGIALYRKIKNRPAVRIGRWHLSGFVAGLLLWVVDFALIHVMDPKQGGLLNWILD